LDVAREGCVGDDRDNEVDNLQGDCVVVEGVEEFGDVTVGGCGEVGQAIVDEG